MLFVVQHCLVPPPTLRLTHTIHTIVPNTQKKQKLIKLSIGMATSADAPRDKNVCRKIPHLTVSLGSFHAQFLAHGGLCKTFCQVYRNTERVNFSKQNLTTKTTDSHVASTNKGVRWLTVQKFTMVVGRQTAVGTRAGAENLRAPLCR